MIKAMLSYNFVDVTLSLCFLSHATVTAAISSQQYIKLESFSVPNEDNEAESKAFLKRIGTDWLAMNENERATYEEKCKNLHNLIKFINFFHVWNF